jgi:nitroreductase
MSTNFLDLLKNRRSFRRFTPQAVESEKIEQLKKAVLMSPAGKRSNPWEFIIVQDKETLEKLSTCREHGAEFVARAPLAFVIVGDTEKSDTWIEDCSISAIILQLAAADLGLGSCWAHCRNRKQADGTLAEDFVRQTLNIPSKYAVLNMVAIGYKDEERKPFDEEKLQFEKIHNEKF